MIDRSSVAQPDFWEEVTPDIRCNGVSVGAPFVSIVIPVLNDTASLVRLLHALDPHPEVEIIVVNGGAADPQLTAVTERRDVRLLPSAPGRGRQMNVGA